jgi:hypothetical protein
MIRGRENYGILEEKAKKVPVIMVKVHSYDCSVKAFEGNGVKRAASSEEDISLIYLSKRIAWRLDCSTYIHALMQWPV